MYKEGDWVWLTQPRQKAVVLGPESNGTYIVSLKLAGTPVKSGDDGLREVPIDQIEGLA